MNTDAVTSAILGSSVAIVSGLIALLFARKAGVATFQRDAADAATLVISRLKERVTQLETDLSAEKAKTVALETTNLALERRIDVLERKIADLVLAAEPSRG
jgi:polyhydroxyalkanoate synthesis regulator phasin